VAEGARLESVFTRKGNVGSNPTLSATQSQLQRNCLVSGREIRENASISQYSSEMRTGENGLRRLNCIELPSLLWTA
jgi:hypothetical protein